MQGVRVPQSLPQNQRQVQAVFTCVSDVGLPLLNCGGYHSWLLDIIQDVIQIIKHFGFAIFEKIETRFRACGLKRGGGAPPFQVTRGNLTGT